MKKKNIILFIIDSLNNTRIRRYGEVLMPYFTELRKEYCYCDSMYSQAPYTEAALMNLYCGQDVLQNNGYMFRFKNAEQTVFEMMKNKGYTTFFNSYQPQCYPSSLRRGVDDIYYNVGFDIGAFWSYRLAHFSELHKKNELTESDYKILTELLKDNFKEWIIFLDNLINKDSSVEMIYGNAGGYNAFAVKKEVQAEQDLFESDTVSYINDVLSKGKGHRIFKITAYDQVTKIKDRSFVEKKSQELKSLYRTIWWTNIRRNVSSFPTLFGIIVRSCLKFIKEPSSVNKKEFLKASYYSLNHLIDFDLKQRGGKNYDWFKNAPSARTHLNHFFKWADEYKSDKPFFACVHVDDVHNPEVFLTYDTDDCDLFNQEVSIAQETLKKLPKKSKGSVTHDLSLSYIDNVIKYLMETLKEKNYGNDTSVVICADHGFSFCGDPIRETYVTNLYLENYNMPFLVVDKSLRNTEIKGLHESKDIPGFIERLADDSKNALKHLPEYSACTIEYCGGGCPDLSRRLLKISAFDNTYFVGTLCRLYDDLNKQSITEIYNLNIDPEQELNLKDKEEDLQYIEHLLSIIKRRKKEIRNSIRN